MSNKFDAYATNGGEALVALIENPAIVPLYRELTKRQRPAVQAVVEAAAPIIEAAPEGERDFMRQFCGYWVGQVMRKLGYRIAQSGVRITIKNSPLRTGTVWETDPASISVQRTPANDDNRIELRVFEKDGQTMAEWRVVLPLGKPSTPAEALAAAKAYAQAANDVRTIVLDDPHGRIAA